MALVARCALLALAFLAAACTSTPSDLYPTDAGGLVCRRAPMGSGIGWVATFPTFDSTCTTDTDCGFASYVSDCCGSLRAIGVRAELVAEADSLGGSCGYGACGCRGDVFADDGATTSGRNLDAVVVACVAGRCTTSLMSPTVCGDMTCAPGSPCITDCTSATPRCVWAPRFCRGPGADCSCFAPSQPCAPTGTCVGVGDGGVPVCSCGG